MKFGAAANLEAPPSECTFAPRCPFVETACTATVPSLEMLSDTRAVRCIRSEEGKASAAFAGN